MKLSGYIKTWGAASGNILFGMACFHLWGIWAVYLSVGLYVSAYVFAVDVLDMIERRIDGLTITIRDK